MKTKQISLIALMILMTQMVHSIQKNCHPDDIDLLNSNDDTVHRYISVDDVNAHSMAENSTEQWNRERNTVSPYLFKLECVRNIKYQIVAGMLYTINATLTETRCERSRLFMRRAPLLDVSVCEPRPGGITLNCAFIFWTQVWLDNYSLLDSRCIKI